MRIAIISDIHGNAIALEAVLADIKQMGVDQIICLGDLANAGPFPSRCIDIVRDVADVVIQGNHELYVLGQHQPDDVGTSPIWSGIRWVQAQMRPDQMAYIQELPYSYNLVPEPHRSTLFTHGSPKSQFLGFRSDYDDEAFAERMMGLDNLTLFVGHTHRMLFQRWSRSWIINVGSVGMSLDGTPEAKYGVATWENGHWQMTFRLVSYNVKQLMQAFEQSGYQAAGGVVSALFRYQMYTGQNVLSPYFTGLEAAAKAQGISMSDLYPNHPVPPFVQQWVIN